MSDWKRVDDPENMPPLDCEKIIVWVADSGPNGRTCFGRTTARGRVYADGHSGDYTITHWRPDLTPPKDTQGVTEDEVVDVCCTLHADGELITHKKGRADGYGSAEICRVHLRFTNGVAEIVSQEKA